MIQKSASAYERHQFILQLLDETDSVRVPTLAAQLGVSESTIRTDLETLNEQGRLLRVRGGAVAKDANLSTDAYVHQKSSQHYSEKQWLARWAASMVEDGDTIMLDASSTVLHIAEFLTDRRNLVIFTNGVNVARLLAKEPSNTVIILGGILRSNGNAITGAISQSLLQDYHIERAFLSCSGFAPDVGFFESDIQEAQMKTLMLQATQQRIVLLDSSRVGRVGLTTFATLQDVDYVAVDADVAPATVEQVRSTQTHVVVCGEQTTRSYSPKDTPADTLRIGFANLSEHTSFSRDVRRGLEKAVTARGGIELVLADNQLNPDVALQVADEFLKQDLDLVIEYQIDENVGNLIAHQFQQANIPVIAVDIPMVGATYFGVNNYIAGKMAGRELAKAIQRDWDGHFERLIIVEQSRTGKLPAMRIKGQLDGLQDVLPPVPEDKAVYVDFDNTVDNAYEVIKAVLEGLPVETRLAVVGFNDDAAVGALHAARDTGHIQNLKLVGQGADRRLRLEMRKARHAVVGSTAFTPEAYGEHLLTLALDILNGKQVQPAVYMDHFFVSPSNVDTYYPEDTDEQL